MMPLILASASPRRRELLERIGIAVTVRVPDIDECPLMAEDPRAYVARIARGKADATARAPGEWLLAADTTVTIDGAILGKAESPAEATAMLAQLAGRTHEVMTAFTLVGDGVVVEEVVVTLVRFVDADAAMIADYVASDEWRGKAGAYAVQGIGAALVAEVRGSVTSVAGLPLAEVMIALRRTGAAHPHFAAGHAQ